MEIVVHFLGLLELYKQGLVELEQATTFGELRVVWTGGIGRRPLTRTGMAERESRERSGRRRLASSRWRTSTTGDEHETGPEA